MFIISENFLFCVLKHSVTFHVHNQTVIWRNVGIQTCAAQRDEHHVYVSDIDNVTFWNCKSEEMAFQTV